MKQCAIHKSEESLGLKLDRLDRVNIVKIMDHEIYQGVQPANRGYDLLL